MSRASPMLASIQRRVLALVVDTALLSIASLALIAFTDGAGPFAKGAAVVLMPFIFFVYHVAVLLHPVAGMGRVVAGISVVSAGETPLGVRQATLRAVVRCVLFAVGLTASMASAQVWVALLPAALEVFTMTLGPLRQSLADRVAGTLVIRMPDVQPHRAPAAPMFSRTDAEFGVPPRRHR